MPRAVLAFSGDLETTVALHWLKYKKGYDVIIFGANLGPSGHAPHDLGQTALELGATAAHIGDLRQKFIDGFVLPSLKANAQYESGYLLATALARPLVVSEMSRLAAEDGCDTLAYGGAFRGNDILRFEANAAQLNPHCRTIAPLREAGFRSREEIKAYAVRHGLHAPPDDDDRFGSDANIWGRAIMWRDMNDAWTEIPEDGYRMTRNPREAPDQPASLTVTFEEGEPRRLNGEPMSPLALIERLNAVGGEHGVGRMDAVENRVVGTKIRAVYEAPAATILHRAHTAIESLVLGKDLLHFKEFMSHRYAKIIFDGHWFSELRQAMDAFFLKTQTYVTGEARMNLYKGTSTVAGIRSEYSLFDPSGPQGELRAEAARGFSEVWSLPSRVEALHLRRGRLPAGRPTRSAAGDAAAAMKGRPPVAKE